LFRLVIDLKITKETKTRRKENEQILRNTAEPQRGSACSGIHINFSLQGGVSIRRNVSTPSEFFKPDLGGSV